MDYKDYFKGKDWVHMLGFYSNDWEAFAKRHHELFGSGPFYYTTNTFGKLLYHGEEVDCSNLEFHACYGAWGSHSIEVVQQTPTDVPTMFTEMGIMDGPAFNHIHIFVDDLNEAIEACKALDIEVVTVGYSDFEATKAKFQLAGKEMTDEQIQEYISKPSFVVIDMRPDFGTMVQLIEPSAKTLHDMILQSAGEWDGETDVIRPLGA